MVECMCSSIIKSSYMTRLSNHSTTTVDILNYNNHRQHPCGRKVHCGSLNRTQINFKNFTSRARDKFLCQGSNHSSSSMVDLAMVQWGEYPTMVKKLFHATSFFGLRTLLKVLPLLLLKHTNTYINKHPGTSGEGVRVWLTNIHTLYLLINLL